MNNRKIILLIVLVIAVIGLTMGSVTAANSTTNKKAKYKTVELKTKYKKVTKKTGRYTISTEKLTYKDLSFVGISVYKKTSSKKGKYLTGNQFYTQIYFKKNGKSQKTIWTTGYPENKYQLSYGKGMQISKVKVRFRTN